MYVCMYVCNSLHVCIYGKIVWNVSTILARLTVLQNLRQNDKRKFSKYVSVREGLAIYIYIRIKIRMKDRYGKREAPHEFMGELTSIWSCCSGGLPIPATLMIYLVYKVVPPIPGLCLLLYVPKCELARDFIHELARVLGDVFTKTTSLIPSAYY